MQKEHRTEAIWRNQMDKDFRSDKALKVMGHKVVKMDPRLTNYVANVGFLPWTQVCNVNCDPRLITALVERWRPETHTFHLNGGEATITLQDVSLLTGLPIDGEPVSGLGELEWEPVCLCLLGVVPDRPKYKSMGSKTWFNEYLTRMPADADEEMLKKYARAYILCLLGLTLVADLSGDQVPLHYLPLLANLDNARRYSWGSAVLAYQYSQMCRASYIKKSQIGGCALLLQFWCWERMRIGRPQSYDRDPPELQVDMHPYYRPCWSYLSWARPKHFEETPRGSLIFYRDQLERMNHADFIYRPYEEDLMERLHPVCLDLEAVEGFTSTADSRPIFQRIFHTVVDELRVLGELRLLNINPDTIQFGNGDDDDMSVDDDHVTNLDSQTPCYDRPSSSQAPPSQPSRASMSYDTPSPPSHGHNLRPAKAPKQSWLQKLRNKRKD
ncbi:hypothetical protein QQ045_012346 [Rhodiola kirilowii]